jgi:hypothetical protein
VKALSGQRIHDLPGVEVVAVCLNRRKDSDKSPKRHKRWLQAIP